MRRYAVPWLMALVGTVVLAAGCVPFGPAVRADQPTPVGTVDALHLVVLGTATGVTSVMWSPSGTRFAFAIPTEPGTFILGTTHPLRLETVNFANARSIVALTDTSAVVASSQDTRDWIYSLQGLTLGAASPWNAPTDTWQEWVDTATGPAVVTGGYRPGTVALQWASGRRLLLHGNQVYASPDGRFGAVVGGHRPHRGVSSVGGGIQLTPMQPANPQSPIAIWEFGGQVPHRLHTLHLPPVHIPEATIDTVAFSPNDRYVAISVMSFDAPPPTPGHTFVYSVRTGRLLGTGPWGNGMAWSSTSQALWLGTAAAEGQGSDHLMAVNGKMVHSWPDSASNQLVGFMDAHTLIMVKGPFPAAAQRLVVWNPFTGRDLTVARASPPGQMAWSLSPKGTAAIFTVSGQVIPPGGGQGIPPGPLS